MEEFQCVVVGCTAVKHRAKGFCGFHYQRHRLGTPLDKPIKGSQKTCSRPDCERSLLAKGLCGFHYQRQVRGTDLDTPTRQPKGPCSVEGCETQARCKGFCDGHYARWRKNGDPGPAQFRQRGLGTIHSKHGYRVLFRPGHPNADKNGRILEHRLVMSEMLGRPLLPGEVVHHKNGVRLDNRPDNLELWITMQPQGQRTEDMTAYARELMARYDPAGLAR